MGSGGLDLCNPPREALVPLFRVVSDTGITLGANKPAGLLFTCSSTFFLMSNYDFKYGGKNEKGRKIMKQKSNVAAGEFLIDGTFPYSISFLFPCVAQRPVKKKKTTTTIKKQLQWVQGNNIKCSLMTFFMGDRVEKK